MEAFWVLVLGLPLIAALVAGGSRFARRRTKRRLSQTTVLIGEAMRRLDLRPADAEGTGREAILVAAVAACRRCPCTEACRGWLAGDVPLSPSACANAGALAQWRIAREERRRGEELLPPFAPL